MIWHLLSGEYPPHCGGVGDHTAVLAQALANAGDTVHVWVPGARPDPGVIQGLHIHALPDRFGQRSRAALGEAWTRNPGVVLLQYVPNALGMKGANLGFCRWLRARAAAGSDVRIFFHEPYFYFTARRPWRNGLALVQRAMASLLLQAATRVYVSSERWLAYLEPYGTLQGCEVLPIPATIPEARPLDGARVRLVFADHGCKLVGHFGTYGQDVGSELRGVARELLANRRDVRLLLLGDGGERFIDQLKDDGTHVGRVVATGRLDAFDVAGWIAACDLLVQPYPDGVTTRRTSIMAGLRSGIATLTTDGFLTEPLWRESAGVALAPAGDAGAIARAAARLLDDDPGRAALGERGRRLYSTRFSMERTVAALRSASAVPQPVGS